MEKMKCSPNEMAFKGCLVHTLRYTKMQVPKNLGCHGAELLTFLTLYKFFAIFLTLAKNFNTVYLLTMFATFND